MNSKNNNVKGVILTAGYGTRFLPATKTIPKEMLPIITKPAIEYILDEFEQSGIKDVIIINSRRKKSLEDYLDREIELENFFNEHKKEYLDLIKSRDLNISFIRQKEMKGTGHALLQAIPFLGDSPFVVVYPDDIILDKPPVSKKMIEYHNKYDKMIMTAQDYSGKDVSSYGVYEIGKEVEENLFEVKRIVEKPKKGSEPSKFISIGRYLYTNEFNLLQKEKYSSFKGLEFYHIDSINELASDGKVLCFVFPNKRFDIGTPSGFLELTHYEALNDPKLKDNYIKLWQEYEQQTNN